MKSPRPIPLGRFAARAILPALLVSVAAAGCIKVRLTVRIEEDGSGEVIEEVVFGEKLVNVSARLAPEATKVETLVAADHVRQRAERMAPGVTVAGRKVENLPDGSVKLSVIYKYPDISRLKVSPIPFGGGWEKLCLAFNLSVPSRVDPSYTLSINMVGLDDKPPGRQEGEDKPPPMGELEAQQVRQLLPIFKDLLEGFELSLRLEVYRYEQWATVTKAHGATGGGTDVGNDLPMGGGRLTVYHITDQNLYDSDDGMLLVVPWRQEGREFDLVHFGYPPGPRIMPYTNFIHGGRRFYFEWHAFQTPHGREYY